MSKQYGSRVMASHETAEGLTTAGVMSKQTMREFDELYYPILDLTVGLFDVGMVVSVRRQAASDFSLASGMVSRKVCIGVLP
jgi:hypothetical protein